MDKIINIQKTKKLGLLIHSGSSIFGTGILQNAYFLYQCFESLGMKCEFLCHDKDPTPFDYRSLPIKRISMEKEIFDPSEYHTIMTITKGIPKAMYDYLKTFHIFIVAFLCGNNYIIDMEDFVRGSRISGNIAYIGTSAPCDELWVIPSYKHGLDYLSIVRRTPSFIVPHLWSPQIIQDNLKEKYNDNESNITWKIANHTSKKITILILEPNQNITKTAWLPLLAAEKLNQENPDLIENVYLFNCPAYSNTTTMLSEFTITPKIKKFARLPITEILCHFNKNGFPIIVSHQLYNELNYLYYEAMYYGWPLVHNSVMMKEHGYYYSDVSISECAEQIKYAHSIHNKHIDTIMIKARAYLETINPLNPDVAKIWDQLIKDGISKSI